MTLPALPFAANFMHPLMMWGLLAAGGYSMFLGIKAKKVRTGTPEQRKALLPGKFAQRHYRWGSLILAVMVTGMIGGMAVTYINIMSMTRTRKTSRMYTKHEATSTRTRRMGNFVRQRR